MADEMIPYTVIENYMDPEHCKYLLDYFIENQTEDPRPFYGNFGLGGHDKYFVETRYNEECDESKKLYDMMFYAQKFFLDNYTMKGEFELNRSHANLMYPGALLHPHKDDRNFDEPIEGLPSMTYVCGLFLTEDYEGGELVFEDYGVQLKPKVGSLVFFPGFYTKHGVNEVKSGLRANILTHFFDIVDRDNLNPAYAIPFVPNHDPSVL